MLQTAGSDDASKAADMLDRASQIDAREAETRRLAQPADPIWKDLAATLRPLLSTLILTGTLVFHISQARIATLERREEEERRAEREKKRRLNDALDLTQKAEEVSPATALINSFTSEPSRTIRAPHGVTIIGRAKTLDHLQDLFTAVMEPVSAENLAEVLTLMLRVSAQVNPLQNLTWDRSTNDLEKLRPEQVDDYNLWIAERSILSVQVAAALRRPRPNAEAGLDLSNLGIDGADLSGADLRHADLTSSDWAMVNLDGADLDGITRFENCFSVLHGLLDDRAHRPAAARLFQAAISLCGGPGQQQPAAGLGGGLRHEPCTPRGRGRAAANA